MKKKPTKPMLKVAVDDEFEDARSFKPTQREIDIALMWVEEEISLARAARLLKVTRSGVYLVLAHALKRYFHGV